MNRGATGGSPGRGDPRGEADPTAIRELFGLMLDAADGEAPIEEARSAMDLADAGVRTAVERLLEAHRRAEGVLLHPPPEGTLPSEHPAEHPDHCMPEANPAAPRISGYEIGEEIGRGGFGMVYRARQLSPVERPVAIKVLRTELATPEVLARFRAESRTLARMNHAGIARVLDAGLDEMRRPFVAMELVRGEPLTAYCESNALSVRERLHLMVEVCDAVHHAHQRAVIHRDLKPANILVERIDHRHQPRVIDFGIAKILEDNVEESHTQIGTRLGTPRYMSPEQAGGRDRADVRSDVYALGVLLCEALTGHVPRDPAGTDGASGSRARARATRPSQLAASSPGEIALRSRELRGDLDRIVLKAVALEPDERYDSAAALGDDLQRYLDGLPVAATAPSLFYLTRKFIARRRLTSAAILLAALSLLGGTAAAMYGMNRANESRAEAEQQTRRAAHEAAIAREINEFWIDIIERSSPQAARRPDLKVREALDLAAPHLPGRITDPGVRLRMHETFADAYHALGLHEPQLHHAHRAHSLLDRTPSEDAGEVIRVLHGLALALLESHELDEAAAVLDEALGLARSRGDVERNQLPKLLQTQARVEDRAGHFARAEELYLEAVRTARERLGPTHVTTLANEKGHALMLVKLGRTQEALDQLVPLLALLQEALGEDHPETIAALTTLASARQTLGRFDEAERDYAMLLDLSIPVLGEDHPYILVVRNNLASLLREMRRFEEAEVAFRAVRESHLRLNGPDHPATLRATANLAMTLMSQNKYEECEPLLVEAIEGRRRVLGDEHPDTINVRHVLANVYLNTDRLEEARELYAVLLQQLREAVPEGNIRLAPLLRTCGILMERGDQIEEALPFYIESYEILLNAAGPEHPQTTRGKTFICDALAKLADVDAHPSWRDQCRDQ